MATTKELLNTIAKRIEAHLNTPITTSQNYNGDFVFSTPTMDTSPATIPASLLTQAEPMELVELITKKLTAQVGPEGNGGGLDRRCTP